MNRFLSLFSALGLCAISMAGAAEYPQPLTLQQDRTLPFSFIGQLFFSSGNTDYIGSGTVIKPSSILTAGHNLYDPDTGWSTDLMFRRGAYGTNVLSTQYASRIYLLSGYRANATTYGAESVRTFATDTGGLLFPKTVANGGYAGWTTKTSLLTGSAYKIAVGYGAEKHSGDYPLFVTPDWGFTSTYGAFYESTSVYFEGGMSGGPVLCRDADGKMYVSGVVVSSSTAPRVAGGIRILNSTVASLIQTYLR